MKRAIILVIDSLGVGAMEDAPDYGDSLTCNTLSNLAKASDGLRIPTLQSLGLGNITTVQGAPPTEKPVASFGRMLEASAGKDTTTGHWEMAGIVLDKPFKTYPNGFPQDLMMQFIKEAGCSGYLGNVPASGTAIIDEFDTEHQSTGRPIIYTSADSVFQIACDVNIVPLEILYKWCEIARNLLNNGYGVSRVIARPYQQSPTGLQRIAAHRKDYSVLPPKGTLLDSICDENGRVIAVGKIEDIFLGAGISHSIHTGSNQEGLEVMRALIRQEINLNEFVISQSTSFDEKAELIFVNLVDTDMLFGHRRNPKGYAKALEEIDGYLAEFLELLTEDDLLIITADHGCDPTAPGSDHTREMVPLIRYVKNEEGINLGTKSSFTYISTTVADWLGTSQQLSWVA